VHWSLGLLVIICIATGAVLYNGSLEVMVGHRRLVRDIHVYCGFGLPVPLLAGLASAPYRQDLRRLNRFTRRDWRWLRSRSRRDGEIRVGKFNAGQKLNAALSCAGILLLFGSGLLMRFPGWTRLTWRTGATFVHDWVALAFGLLVLGHLWYAVRDPEALHGMRTGEVDRRWAQREHASWADEFDGADSTDRTDRADRGP
jgi:formate dehydrogenase subunit gamma